MFDRDIIPNQAATFDTIQQDQLVARCKAYVTAKADYETNAYDVFVECYGTDEWVDFIGDLTSFDEIVASMEEAVGVWEERRADAATYQEW